MHISPLAQPAVTNSSESYFMEKLIRRNTLKSCADLAIHMHSGAQGLAEKFPVVERLPVG